MESSTTSSSISFNPLFNNTLASSLKTLICIVETCIGPRGRLKVIQNVTGSSISVTSSSQRLFHHISVKNIFSKIIISAAKSQLKSFNDGGLACALLASKLITNSMLFDCSLPPVGALHGYFGKLYIECLRSDKSTCSFSINFSNLHHLQSVVCSLLSSKSGCVLTSHDRTRLCTLLLEAFLNVIPGLQSILENGNIKIFVCEGNATRDSRLFKGVLVPVSRTDCELTLHTMDSSKVYKVVLFSVSLSGDEGVPVKNVEVDGVKTFSEGILKHMERLISKLLAEDVDIVFCQKVIHPRIKKQLLDRGLMVLDKLGAETAMFLQYISGGSTNSAVVSELDYGIVHSCQKVMVGKDHFLLFRNNDIPFFTLVICNYNAEAASELKVVCQQVLDTLFRILKSPKVCFGAGCTEICTAHLLVQKVKDNLNAIKEETGCTDGLIACALQTFLHSIEDVAVHQASRLDFVTENNFGHLWKLRDGNFPTAGDSCQCGCIIAGNFADSTWLFLSDIGNLWDSPSKELLHKPSDCPAGVVLDDLNCKVNACSLAFETASLLLRTSICVNNLPQTTQPIA